MLLNHYQDSTSGTPVTLRVDAKGFYLCWVDQNNEIDLLDIAIIRDVRTGQYAKRPRVSFRYIKLLHLNFWRDLHSVWCLRCALAQFAT